MKKINIVVCIAILLAIVIFSSFVISVLKPEVNVIESPTGDYRIVSWLIDIGAAGYRGAYYIKEKGVFSKWYKLGTGPFSGKWLSETEFSIDHSKPIDGNWRNWARDNYYKEYNVNEFFGK